MKIAEDNCISHDDWYSQVLIECMVQERQLCGAGAAERSYPLSRVRGGGREELPHVQCMEQRVLFARTAVKRYSTAKVRDTQVRW